MVVVVFYSRFRKLQFFDYEIQQVNLDSAAQKLG